MTILTIVSFTTKSQNKNDEILNEVHLTQLIDALRLGVDFTKYFLRTFNFFCCFGLACGRDEINFIQLIPQWCLSKLCCVYIFNFAILLFRFFAFCASLCGRLRVYWLLVARAEFARCHEFDFLWLLSDRNDFNLFGNWLGIQIAFELINALSCWVRSTKLLLAFAKKKAKTAQCLKSLMQTSESLLIYLPNKKWTN